MDFKLINKDVLDNFLKELAKVPLDGTYTVELKKRSKKRTLPQNALFHDWVGTIAKDTGGSAEWIKDDLKFSVLGSYTSYHKGKPIEKIRHSSEATVAEFIELMNATADLARMLNIKLKDPSYYGYKEIK